MTVIGDMDPVDLVKRLGYSFSNVRVVSIEKVNDKEGTSKSLSNMEDKVSFLNLLKSYEEVEDEDRQLTSNLLDRVQEGIVVNLKDKLISLVNRETLRKAVKAVKAVKEFFPTLSISKKTGLTIGWHKQVIIIPSIKKVHRVFA